MRELLSYFSPHFPTVLVYMLQSVEYEVGPYLQWVWRMRDFTTVMRRRQLELTRPARLLLLSLRIGMSLQILLGIGLFLLGIVSQQIWQMVLALLIMLAYPVAWAHLIVVPLLLGRWLIIAPRQQQEVIASEKIFAKAKGVVIAVAGSYGKTTMKELLVAVLGQEKKIAATPANKNVAIAHARLAQTFTGDEEIIILEYGESRPGDIARFARMTHPSIGIITGLAPAHLDMYKTVAAAGADLLTLADYLHHKNVYFNGESDALRPLLQPTDGTYTAQSALGWKVHDIEVSIEGTNFVMSKGHQVMHLHSGLLGRHQVGPLALVAALARELGLDKAAVEQGIGQTKPFEHRMEPRLVAGAWLVDDTYNGNIEGMKAGLALLAELPATRKIYVTPGLVDQGEETEPVHHHLGKLIAAAAPNVVVLMKNSATPFIQQGLQDGGYTGALLIETDPLAFYTDLTQTTAAGDLVLMQNDWTDNYS